MSKFSKTPGIKRSQPSVSAEEFIEAANVLPNTESYPWIGQDDVKRRSLFNIRLTDAEMQKLKFISKNTPKSMHEFCVDIIAPAIEQKIQELTRK